MDEIRRIYEKQQANRWRVAQSSANERIAKLRRLRDGVLKYRDQLQQAIFADFRKNPGETDLTEVLPTVAEINHTIKHLRAWMKPKRVRTPLILLGTSSRVHCEAKGLVLILSPWNYPFQLLINPLAGAIAAGNCVVLKPSSKVPATMAFLKRFIGDLFDESEVALVEGSSAVSDALLELKWDHIFFTGSPRIGKTVMAAAAKQLTPVTLELGGKSPVIVDETADMKSTAARLMWGKFINAGQTCVAPDHLYLHESRLDEFVAEAKRVVAHRFGSGEQERESSPDFCRMVSAGNYASSMKILQESIGQGARVEFGGVGNATDKYIAPTLLTGVREDMAIMRDEIFAPILPVLTYRSLDDVIRVIQAREKPLALYLFSKNKATIKRILRNTTAGGTCVNTTVLHLVNNNLPFGGVGQSGMGNYHGFFGFRQLSNERAVLHQTKIDTVQLLYPPYTKTVRKLIQLTIRLFC